MRKNDEYASSPSITTISSSISEPRSFSFFSTTSVWLFVFLLATIAWTAIFPDVIHANHGFGADGLRYAQWIPQFPKVLLDHSISPYYIQRTLVSAQAHYVMKALKISFSDRNILNYMEIYQAGIKLACLATWLAISSHLKLSRRATVLGFVAFFVNFPMLKLYSYYPMLLDNTAMLLGLLCLYFYLTDSLLPLLLVSVAGSLVYPTTVVMAPLLILLPKRFKVEFTSSIQWAVVLPIVLYSLAYATGCYYVYYVVDEPVTSIAAPVRGLLPLSIFIVTLYNVGALSCALAKVRFNLTQLFAVESRINWQRWAGAGFLLLFHLYLTHCLAAPKEYPLLLHQMQMHYFWVSTTRPLQFLIAHIIYFGPFVATLALTYQKVAEESAKLGVGALAVFAFCIALSIDSESRHLVNILPFVVVPFIVALDKMRTRSSFVIEMFVSSLIVSRFWLPINLFCPALSPPVNAEFPFFAEDYSGVPYFLRMPYALYFVNFGPFTSNSVLLIVFCITVAVLPVLQPHPMRESWMRKFWTLAK